MRSPTTSRVSAIQKPCSISTALMGQGNSSRPSDHIETVIDCDRRQRTGTAAGLIKSFLRHRHCTVICFGFCFGDSVFGMCTVRMPSLLSQLTISAFTFSGSEKPRSKLP